MAIEAKAGKGIPTALQEKNMRDIKAAGGIATVVNEENLDWLRGAIKIFKEQK